MKIAIFSDSYPPEINGVATSCKSLRDILVKNGHSVLVVTTNPVSSDVAFEDNHLRIPGIEMKKIYGYRFARLFSPKAYRIIKKFNPDLVHIHTDFSIGIIGRNISKSLRIPLVYTYHTMYEDYTYYFTKGHFDRLMIYFLRLLSRNVVKKSDQFITPSLKTHDYMRQIGVDNYINIIPTGVDFSKFNPSKISKRTKTSIRKKYKINEDDFIVLSLGRIAKEKSIDVCIDGFSTFINDNPNINAKFMIVGKGPAVEELTKKVEDMNLQDKVIFVGPCLPSEVQNYYAIANVFVSASTSETQGLTYMEAMASKIYVIAKYDHNLLDVIQEDHTGFYFESNKEFSNKLLKVYNLSQIKDVEIINNALKGIDKYSIDTFYNSIINVYNKALRNNY